MRDFPEDSANLRFVSEPGTPSPANLVDVINVLYWLEAFASPRVVRRFPRPPPREHILKMVDIYLAYVRRGEHAFKPQAEPVPDETREALAVRLREVFETWTSSELPGEVQELARALMNAEGIKAPAVGWDNYEGDPSMPPLEECLLWPEGVPALLKSQSK